MKEKIIRTIKVWTIEGYYEYVGDKIEVIINPPFMVVKFNNVEEEECWHTIDNIARFIMTKI